jgi:peptide/nickel transport system substrate-binding protein
MKKVDDHTVDFILEAPQPILLRNIIDFRIMSKAWSEKNKSENTQDYKAKEDTYASRNVNGTGPYKITGMDARPAHRDDHPQGLVGQARRQRDRGDLHADQGDPTRVAALLSGDVDMLTDLPVQDVARLRQDPKLKVLDGHEVRTIFIALDEYSPELKFSNVKGKNPFKDKRVREALNDGIDREAIKRNTMRGLSMPAAIMVAPGVNGHSQRDRQGRQGRHRAREEAAGRGRLPAGLRVQLNCPNNRYVNDEEICQNVVAMWARAGVKTKLVAESLATFIQKVQNFDTSAYLLGWGVATFDAQYRCSR